MTDGTTAPAWIEAFRRMSSAHWLGDRRRFNRVADQRLKQRIGAGLLDRVELAVLQVLDPGREAEAQQMTEAEHMIGRAGGIGVVLGDAQVGLVRVMVQPVENVGRLAHRRRDHPGVERSVLAGHVSIEDHAGVDAVLGVDGAAGSGATAGAEILAVRGRGRTVVPDRGHRMSVMGVDDGGAGGDVVVVADVPLRHVDQ